MDEDSIQLGVLVVSPDVEFCSTIGQAIEELGHQLEFRSDADDAVSEEQPTRPSLAIIDWQLGADAATAAISSLRKPVSGGRSYVLVIASSAGENGNQAIVSCRADDVLLGTPTEAQLALSISIAERRIREEPGFRQSNGAEQRHLATSVPTALGPNDAWWEWNVPASAIRYSSRWMAMLGYEEEMEIALDEDHWLNLVHPDDIDALKSDLDNFVEGKIKELDHGHRLRFMDGSYRWILTRGFAIRGEDNKAEHVIGLQTDITSQMLAEQKLQYEALHDPLTGLPNRGLFTDRLRHVFSRVARRPQFTFAVLFFDVDRFKNVNDSLGHIKGDRLLRSIATRLESALRPSDTVARFGGDEFVILIEDIVDIRSATAVAQRVHQEFSAPFDLGGIEIFAGISIGIAVWSDRYESPEDLLRDADTAMYRAKAAGRNRFAVFDQEMHQTVVAELSLENDLRRAMDMNEFEVYYQPIAALDRGRIAGFEALVRWQHPERGLVSPAEFIPLAEEIGLVIQIDRWVLETACEQLRNWQVQFRRNDPLTVNVNVSGIQFMQADLVSQIDHILRKTGLYGQSLNLEITESLIMEDAGHAGAMIEQLKKLNIGIAIDDFGTGYSSLAYLRRFHIDALKIDRSFVSRMLKDEDSREIVRTIITLASSIGKVTVVEGVEQEEELEQLHSMGADRIQGYYLSRPLPAEDAGKLLQTVNKSRNQLETILRQRARRNSSD
ncbi:MAG: EAL domain-containing protein [bacterium]|nr:EAL domain-containing protein [bacterium]